MSAKDEPVIPKNESMSQAAGAQRTGNYSWSSLSLSSLPHFDLKAKKQRPADAPAADQAEWPKQAAWQETASVSSQSAPQGPPAPGLTTESDVEFYLHRVCQHFAKEREVVEIALTFDPSAIRRRAQPAAPAQKEDEPTPLYWIRQEQYSYPLNIALQNGGSPDVLELLINAGKDVILKRDGSDRTGALSVALSHRPRDLDAIELIMFSNLQSLTVTDRKLNYPLHLACAKGASVAVLERLYSHYPAALFQKNFHGETPLDVARRSSLLDEKALNYVYEKYQQGCAVVAKNSIRKALTRMSSTSRAA